MSIGGSQTTLAVTLTPTNINWMETTGVSADVTYLPYSQFTPWVYNLNSGEISYGTSRVTASGSSLDIGGSQTTLSVTLTPTNINWMETVGVSADVTYSGNTYLRSGSAPLVINLKTGEISYGTSGVSASGSNFTISASKATASAILTPTNVNWMETTRMSTLIAYGNDVYGLIPASVKEMKFSYGDTFDMKGVEMTPPPFGSAPDELFKLAISFTMSGDVSDYQDVQVQKDILGVLALAAGLATPSGGAPDGSVLTIKAASVSVSATIPAPSEEKANDAGTSFAAAASSADALTTLFSDAGLTTMTVESDPAVAVEAPQNDIEGDTSGLEGETPRRASGIGVGAIIGITVGGVVIAVAAVLVIVSIVCLRKKRKKAKAADAFSSVTVESHDISSTADSKL